MTAQKKILIVDDDPDAVEFSRTVLSDMGAFDLVVASDGEQGISLARSERPDLILLDVTMPKKDGFEVFADLRKAPETESVPVIMLTGVSAQSGIPFSAEDMGEYLGKEPAQFIDKPVDPQVLQSAVTRVLGL